MGRFYTRRPSPKRFSFIKGFTLLELLVVVAIIGILSVILIVGQNTFSRTLILKSTATDISLSLRNAQVYGIGSRAKGAINNAPYGLDFSTASANSYTFFADVYPSIANSARPDVLPGDGLYTTNDNPAVQTYTLNNRLTISNFCALLPPSTWYCKSGGSVAIEHLSIVFKRPNTAAVFGVGSIGSGYTQVSNVSFTQGCISIANAEGTATKAISVSQVGQITSAASCP